MGIYFKARAKITIGTVAISLGIIIGLWLCLFITDYIMYANDIPMLFSKTEVQEIEDKHITTETGLGYYVVTNNTGITEFYLFGHKIK